MKTEMTPGSGKTEYKGYTILYHLKDKIWQVWKGREAIAASRTKHEAVLAVDQLCS